MHGVAKSPTSDFTFTFFQASDNRSIVAETVSFFGYFRSESNFSYAEFSMARVLEGVAISFSVGSSGNNVILVN